MAKNIAKVTAADFNGLTPEEIQNYIDIATEALVEVLTQQGMTAEEFHARRHQIVDEEQKVIESELDALNELGG